MEKVCKQVRQGDVLLHPIKKLPEGAKKENHVKKLVLAEGEVTGHAHVISSKRQQVDHYTKETQSYLVVNEPVTVNHEEHGELVLEPGTYEVRRQVEQWMDEVRKVAD